MITRQAAGLAIIARLQEIITMALPADAAQEITQLTPKEITERLRFAAAASGGEIESTPGCTVVYSKTGICAVSSPSGVYEFDLPAHANYEATSRACIAMAARATRSFPSSNPFSIVP